MTNTSKAVFEPKNSIALRPKVTTLKGIEVSFDNMGDLILLFGTNPRILSSTKFVAKRYKFEIGDIIVFDPNTKEVTRVIEKEDISKKYDILTPKA